MKITWGIADIQNVYGTKKTSQTSTKPFTVPISELTGEKPIQTSKITWSIADIQNVYGTEKPSQTSSKPFTTLAEGLTANEKATTQTKKVTQSFSSFSSKDMLTYIGYDEFDPFRNIAETGSFNIPELMQTKTTPVRSDEEILKDMEELAKEHARMGIFQNNDGKKFAKLIDEYVSSVSPDREGLLKRETNEILERLDSEMYIGKDEDPKKNKELIDYLMEAIGTKKGKDKNDNIIASRSNGYYTQIDIDRGGGKVTSLVYDNNGNLQQGIIIKSDMYEATSMQKGIVDSAFFHDENGNSIASYHNNKLYQKYTKAENERMQEIVGAYNAAFDVAYGSRQIHGNHSNGTSTMDRAYNSAYERLRSEIA